MGLFSIDNISIAAVAATVPSNCIDNSALTILNENEKDNIIHKTGIKVRRIAPDNICASDLCIDAATQILHSLKIKEDDIGILVFVTQTPDFLLPGNSMIVQQKLKLSSSTLLFDLHQGCAGYVYGLATIAAIMNATKIEYGLLLVGDTITRLLSPSDRTTQPIFSDAGSATVLRRSSNAKPICFNLGADGSGFKTISVYGGGAKHPFKHESLILHEDASGIQRAEVHLAMEGLDVLNYSLKNVVPNINQLLQYSTCNADEVDYFLFHQANRILNESILRKMSIPFEKAPETLSVFGNTSNATIPVTLSHCLGNILNENKKKVLLSGFGAGFSWGSALLNIQLDVNIPVHELTP